MSRNKLRYTVIEEKGPGVSGGLKFHGWSFQQIRSPKKHHYLLCSSRTPKERRSFYWMDSQNMVRPLGVTDFLVPVCNLIAHSSYCGVYDSDLKLDIHVTVRNSPNEMISDTVHT